MRAGSAAFLLSVSLCACAPKPDAALKAAPLALDCAQPFAAEVARLTAQPHLVAAPQEPGEPYRFYSTDGGAVSYVVTEPGAPGHPAILMQTASGGQMQTTGCPYGDPKGYKRVLAYIEALKTVRPR